MILYCWYIREYIFAARCECTSWYFRIIYSPLIEYVRLRMPVKFKDCDRFCIFAFFSPCVHEICNFDDHKRERLSTILFNMKTEYLKAEDYHCLMQYHTLKITDKIALPWITVIACLSWLMQSVNFLAEIPLHYNGKWTFCQVPSSCWYYTYSMSSCRSWCRGFSFINPQNNDFNATQH